MPYRQEKTEASDGFYANDISVARGSGTELETIDVKPIVLVKAATFVQPK